MEPERIRKWTFQRDGETVLLVEGASEALMALPGEEAFLRTLEHDLKLLRGRVSTIRFGLWVVLIVAVGLLASGLAGAVRWTTGQWHLAPELPIALWAAALLMIWPRVPHMTSAVLDRWPPDLDLPVEFVVELCEQENEMSGWLESPLSLTLEERVNFFVYLDKRF